MRFTGDSVSGKASGVRADASLKVWTPLLLSPFAHSLFPVCHRLPSCHLYFSVRSVGLWRVSFPFSRWLCPPPGHTTAGPASRACLDMGSGTCLVSVGELFCMSHSGICAFCQHVYKKCFQASHLFSSLVRNQELSKANAYIYRHKRLEFTHTSVKMIYCTFYLFNTR